MTSIQTIASGSTGNCYIINCGSSQLMIECGVSWNKIQKATNFSAHTAAGILITHEHGDHSAGVYSAIKAGMDIFLSSGSADALNITGHRVNRVKAARQFYVGSWTILPFDTNHDAAEPLGFLVQNFDRGQKLKLLFLTDTSYTHHIFKGLTHIMIECNFSDEILEKNTVSGDVHKSRGKRLYSSHMSLSRVKHLLKANDLSGVQSIHLMHLSDQNSDERQFRKDIQALTGIPVYVC